jgi:tRNA threonylcarbamoyladenosine biosynthesis protein TsaE
VNLENHIAQSCVCSTPEETFLLGEMLGDSLAGGELILLSGGLGAGKTLFTKGVLNGLEFDIDEVTSPSFTLVNLYKARVNVYHIDFYRLADNVDVARAVGLDEILEDESAVVIIEWAEKMAPPPPARRMIAIKIEGDGDDPRQISIKDISHARKLVEVV